MIIRIQNGYRAKKEAVVVPHSNVKESIAKVLERKGYIAGIEKKGKKARKFMEISLKYKDGTPAFAGGRRISKPSRRLYVKASEIRPVKYGHGIAVISTSAGVLSNDEAKKKKLGGEIIAEIW
ncbi:MAG: 30S ribosomal protein S8 [Candidatus Sungbacteria bacterium]|uniref:Small ribosomal subunit protein uS8 n=1 Tax=Candidatus Sungiibacteriota bacterium TaxID=2750080 RepID=A0A9D6QVI8_9BACT|nr:30S ribosomal protein S8 [Candidatus Sungbacteria bacterium]